MDNHNMGIYDKLMLIFNIKQFWKIKKKYKGNWT